MPYDPTTPTLVLCRDLAAAVAAAWTPSAPSAVDWDFFRRFGDGEDSATELLGRQVVFFPTRYAWEPGTRGNEDYTHHVTCLVTERYTDQGDPPRDWTAARVDFVHERIVKGLRFRRGGPPAWNPMLLTLGATVEVLDAAKLVGSGKLFYAIVELEFLELVP